jgi:hypothetical protein
MDQDVGFSQAHCWSKEYIILQLMEPAQRCQHTLGFDRIWFIGSLPLYGDGGIQEEYLEISITSLGICRILFANAYRRDRRYM